MKKSILILDNDIQYAKKISNYGIKYKGKEYIFLFLNSKTKPLFWDGPRQLRSFW